MFWSKEIDPDQLKTASEVIEAEKDYIHKSEPSNDKGIWGLGISGGGIRSASIGLGVMQALVAAPKGSILSKIDYLSTVSGGGYIGSALTWFLHKGFPNGDPAGTDPGNFPLGQIGSGARIDKMGKTLTDTKENKNIILNFIRQHGNYLLPGKGLNALSLFGVTIRSIFVSLMVYLSLLTVVMTILNYFNLFKDYSLNSLLKINLIDTPAIPFIVWTALLVIAILAAASIIFSLCTRINMGSKHRYKNSIKGQIYLGKAWAFVFLFSLLGSLFYFAKYLPDIYTKIIASSSISVGSVIGFIEQKLNEKQSNSKSGGQPLIIIVLGAFLLIYGLLLSAYLLSSIFINPFYFIILAASTFIIGTFANLNYAGLHRMYRDRLMEVFMPNADSVIKDQWAAATDADVDLLENMCDKSTRPYHLINTNIVLVDSPATKYRNRGGDSFLLSRIYCGSDATGYILTKDYMKRGKRGMTLSTAITISGAAVNPNTGVAGKGPTRNVLVSALLGILNLRLGYWAINPKHNKNNSVPPNFIIPGLTSDVLAGDLNENKDDIQLTDGGHFENLALYELIRRKAAIIIISDGGADENYQFNDLANAIEKVRVDFGVTIRFDEKYNLSRFLPGSAPGDDKLFIDKFQLAESGFAIADINYNDEKGSSGKLIYLKATLTENLPADIYGYKSAHQSFPNQTTADQFFNEDQFEAYRELGYQLTWQMLNSGIGRKILGIVS
jgi:hypothetical protein